MDVVTPRTLAEALRLKAAHPEAVPLQGGTDLLVELNFDRRRPDVILNLGEVAELRGWGRENGALRLGAGLTYTEALEGPLADALPALAEASRTYGVPSAAGAPSRRRAVPVETSTSTTIVITYGSAWKSCGVIVTPRAWRISGRAENAPKA